ncbi:MAG: tetratricopeptide repeat protein [Kofleriaceae bacterium]|nr:tetratricopeptide repeat protein [Kofleriaceae bacterium]
MSSNPHESAASEIDREEFEKAVVQGNEQLRLGQPGMAALHFQRALDLDAGNGRILAMLGLAHFRAGQFAEARPVYQALINRAPQDASHRLNLGLVNLKLGDADAAIAMLESSRAIDPSSGRAVSYLGLAYARAGRFLEAYRGFLLAGQHDLATEIEQNLTSEQRATIARELPRRGGAGLTEPPPLAVAPAPATADADDASVDAAFDAMDAMEASDAGATVEDAAPEVVPPEPSTSDSGQFVLPRRSSPNVGVPEVRSTSGAATAISRAVAQAAPALGAARTELPPQRGAVSTATLDEPTGIIALSVYATTQLVRPDETTYAFTVAPGGQLMARVEQRLWSRNDGVVLIGGALEFEPATRRIRGQQSTERFAPLGRDVMVVTGQGYFVVDPGDGHFTAVALDDDILYLREDLVYAFEGTLRWENGNVPGMRGQFAVVQFRGDGAVALHGRPLMRVKLSANAPCTVPVALLAGWIGRVVPRAVNAADGGPVTMVECSGEGVILLEPSQRRNEPPR